ncbi:uncharacterized protein G2W53_041980 [Senna tora]|uniref:Uncharacterized protein n=1 Tax=Senna tora TaxID=362788 RepID=A0A834SG20_9FABA|nr:uncharacterized protein G2W53_041980 [Senna tora]
MWNPCWVAVYIGVPEEAKVAVIDVIMEALGALGADRVYSVIGRRKMSRGYCDGTVTALMLEVTATDKTIRIVVDFTTGLKGTRGQFDFFVKHRIRPSWLASTKGFRYGYTERQSITVLHHRAIDPPVQETSAELTSGDGVKEDAYEVSAAIELG